MINITKDDAIRFDLSEDEVKNVIKKAIQKIDIAKMDNLRHRHKNIQLDCLLRGYIGEYCIKKWLENFDIYIETTNYLEDNENIDIDFYYKNKNIELKTSLIPDADVTIDKSIKNRDIKLIRRGNSTIEELRGDLHLQIYYSQKRKAKDNWLKAQQIDIESKDIDYLYDLLNARAYKNTTFFVGWIDKETLVNRINTLPTNKRHWTFPGSQRLFWNCKIQNSKRPIELVDYLKTL